MSTAFGFLVLCCQGAYSRLRPTIPAEISRAIEERRREEIKTLVILHALVVLSTFRLHVPCASVCWNLMALLVVLGEVVELAVS